MRISELLEAPLPSDWDDAIYNNNVSFKKRIEDAKQMALKVGTGSSRIAFEIPYEGRKTILKVAKNRNGIAQNKAECDALDYHITREIELMIPLIDCDERGFTWIHTEYANKVSNTQFIKACGGTPYQLVSYARKMNRHNNGKHTPPVNSPIIEDADLTERFMYFVDNYDNPNIHDYVNIKNWGIYNGKIVIIDACFNDGVQTMYGW